MKDYPCPAITDYLHADRPPTCLPNYPIYVIYLMFAMLYLPIHLTMILFIHASLSISRLPLISVCACLIGLRSFGPLFADCLLLALAAATRVPDMAME